MPKVTFANDGSTAEIAQGSRLMDYCETNETPIAFGCMSGRCATCRVEIVEGSENVGPIGEEEHETLEMSDCVAGERLTCQLVVNGDITIRQPR